MCELHYRKIKPCIIAEEMLRPAKGDLIDYKIVYINGEPVRFIFMNKKTKENVIFIFDTNRKLVLRKGSTQNIDIPDNVNDILDIADKLASDIGIVRVDLYDVDGRVYFGELTFSPQAFLGSWLMPEKWDNLNKNLQEFARSGISNPITKL